MPDSAAHDPNNLLMQGADGKFREAGLAAGLASPARGRGAADLNRDGLLDIAMVNRRAAMEVYQTVTQGAGSWIAVEAWQDGANGRMVGGFVELRAGDRL